MLMVPEARVELAWPKPRDFKSLVYTCSTIRGYYLIVTVLEMNQEQEVLLVLPFVDIYLCYIQFLLLTYFLLYSVYVDVQIDNILYVSL